jgi:hypothetical protein
LQQRLYLLLLLLLLLVVVQDQVPSSPVWRE